MAEPPHSHSVTRQRPDFAAVPIDRQPRFAPLTQLTSFVGREREVETLAALLRNDGARLVTLTGPGGVGKTRLALRVAERLAGSFRHGIVFIPLSSISDAGLVLSAITSTLGVRESPERSTFDGLAAVLSDREVLLLLDNFEQVLPAAIHLADLLAVCPGLQLLVTSRSVLHIYGERDFAVPPLEVPDPAACLDVEQANDAAAIQLFVDRAQAASSGFALSGDNLGAVIEICRRLNGLPLAIELAAARVSHLSPEALVSRLKPSLPVLTGGARNLPERLRTVRAAVAWSYELLTPEEQRLFRRFGAFAGGCTLEAAEAIGGDGEINVLQGVASLVDQSLLRLEEPVDASPRYAMLETIREFAVEQLVASVDEHPTRNAHAAWYAEFCERAQQGFGTAHQQQWLRETELEQPNIRAALAWSLEGDDPDPGLRICRSLGWFWWARGDPKEGKGWIEQAISRNPAANAIGLARLQTQLAEILWSLGDYAGAADLDHRALDIFEAADDRHGIAACLLNLGRIAQDLGNYPEAGDYYERSLAHFRELGEHDNIKRCLSNLGMVFMFQGDLDRAASLQHEALAQARQHGLIDYATKEAFNLGETERRRGNQSAAVALFAESVAVHQRLRERRFIAEAVRGLAQVAVSLGEMTDAAILAGADEAVRESIAARITPEPERNAYEAAMSSARIAIGETAFAEARSVGRQYHLDNSEVVSEVIARLRERAIPQQEARTRKSAELSPRELEVLALLARGMSDREIGDALFISYRTVNGHVARVFEKLGVNSRAEAAVEAVKLGIVSA